MLPRPCGRWSEVLYLETGKNYVTLRLADDNRTIAVRGTLSSVLGEMVPAGLRPSFIRISRRHMLNRSFITGYNATHVFQAGQGFEHSLTAWHLEEQIAIIEKRARITD